MIRFVVAGLCALVVTLATPVAAQVSVPVAKYEAVMDGVNTSLASIQVVDGVLTRVLVEMERVDTVPDDQVVDAIDSLYRSLAEGRQQLRAIVVQLSAIPPIAEAGDPPDVYVADQMIASTLDQARRMDRLLADIETMFRAMESGDEAKFKASAASTQNAVVFMAESMALRLKGMAVLYPEGSFDRAIALATGCFYDGVTAYYRISFSYDTDPPVAVSQQAVDEATSGLSTAIACMQAQQAEAHIYMAAEAERPMATANLTRLRDRLVPVRGDYLANLAFAETILARVRQPLLEGRGLSGQMDALDLDIMAYETRNGEIAEETVRINQTGSRFTGRAPQN
ncbi:MAG: hypothetical protein KKF88_06450 [Alphaproteobacteria bacterium]|nr:hypothetical protein [Alphaproteobacteria bacterium]